MVYGSNSLDDTIRDLGGTYVYVPLVSEGDTDGDGHADIVFGTPRRITGRISSEGSSPYERATLGQNDSIRYYLTVPDEEDVQRDGRVFFRDEAFRITEPMPATNATFSRYTILPDDRMTDTGDNTGTDDGSGSDDTTSGDGTDDGSTDDGTSDDGGTGDGSGDDGFSWN